MQQVKAFRNIFGGIVPIVAGKAGAAITTGYGTPIALQDDDGYYDPCADDATAMAGWLVGGQGHATTLYTPGADAAGDDITFVPAYPGIQALMRVSGTPAIGLKEELGALKLASSAYTVEVDKADADLFKLKEYFTDVEGTVWAWVEVSYTTSAQIVEV